MDIQYFRIANIYPIDNAGRDAGGLRLIMDDIANRWSDRFTHLSDFGRLKYFLPNFDVTIRVLPYMIYN